MADVRLPNGQVITNVPDDTSQAELLSLMQERGFSTNFEPQEQARQDVNVIREQQGLPQDIPLSERATGLAKQALGGLASLGSGVITAGAGAAQVGADTLEFALALDDSMSGAIRDSEVARQERTRSAISEFTGEDLGIGTGLLEGIGEFALPGSVIKASQKVNVFTRILDNAARQGVAGAIEFNETNRTDQRAYNTLISIGFGQGVSAVVEGASLLKNIIRPKGAEKAFIDSDLLTEPEAKKVLSAAEELGITVTPGEASGDKLLQAGERTLIINKASKQDLRDFLRFREEKIVQELDQIRKSAIVGSSFEEHGILQDNLYKEVANVAVDKRRLGKLLKDPNYKDVYGLLRGDNPNAITKQVIERAGLAEGASIPPNSLAWLDRLRQGFDTLIQNGISDTGKIANKARNARLSKARSELSTFLKEEVPGYSEYLSVAQRAVAVNKMSAALDEAPLDKADQISKHFFKQILNKENTRRDLRGALADVPGAQEKLDSIATVLTSLNKSGIDKLLNQEIAIRMATVGQGPLGVAGVNLATQVSGEFNRAIMEYITNPRWTEDIAKIGSIGNNAKRVEVFVKYMSGVASYRESVSRRLAEVSKEQESRDAAQQRLLSRESFL